MTTTNSTPPRDASLDALRGLAVLGMVLSGSLGFGGALPAWMFHAQVPPPLHRFEPALAGISWVDLVFPFFLFAMGAALPLAMRPLNTHAAAMKLSLRRYGLLLFFALFTQHMKASALSVLPSWQAQTLAIAAFVLLSLMLGPCVRWLKCLASALGVSFLVFLPFHQGAGFQLAKSDIILLVLADMALFGGLLWWFTRKQSNLRLGALLLLAAVLLGRSVPGSWNAWLAQFSPAPWAYQFYYLKYLFIVVPGSFAGEWLLQSRGQRETLPAGIGVLALALIVVNLSLLFARELTLNLVLSLALLALLFWRLRRCAVDGMARRYCRAGAYLLILGLALEALEGGIRKDSSTYSYYAVSSGLAFFALLGLRNCQCAVVDYLAAHGRNPLLAYVAGSLVVLPLLHLTSLHSAWSGLNGDAWQALLKGLLFTGAVSGLTLFCTQRNYLWKI